MGKQIPERQCVGCRQMKKKTELVRIIRTPENEICLDKTGRKNGRGAYVCPDKECLAAAMKTKALSRSLNTEIPEDIYQAIMKEMM